MLDEAIVQVDGTVSVDVDEWVLNEMFPTDDGAQDQGTWNDADWHRLWFHLQTQPWRTLTLVPATDQVSTLWVARLISRLARAHGEVVYPVDSSRLPLRCATAYISMARKKAASGDRIVFAAASPIVNPATVTLAMQSDCVVLCVALGMALNVAQRTVELLGRGHIFGSLVVPLVVDPSPDGLVLWTPAGRP